MPQVDLETLVASRARGGIDRKIACETVLASVEYEPPLENDEGGSAEIPPESFWLSKDAEYDWFDRNAFYERKESTKGHTNSTNFNTNSSSNSQRLPVHLKKASIIGLPKTQKATYVNSKRRTCKPPNIMLFPKRTESSAGKSMGIVAEPGSPKVSCMGGVRSKSGRRRLNSADRSEKPAEESIAVRKKHRTGFYSTLINMFRFKKGIKKLARSESRRVTEVLMEETVAVEQSRRSVRAEVQETPLNGDPPALGRMKRFASGRPSGSWTSDDINQRLSGDLHRAGGRS